MSKNCTVCGEPREDHLMFGLVFLDAEKWHTHVAIDRPSDTNLYVGDDGLLYN